LKLKHGESWGFHSFQNKGGSSPENFFGLLKRGTVKNSLDPRERGNLCVVKPESLVFDREWNRNNEAPKLCESKGSLIVAPGNPRSPRENKGKKNLRGGPKNLKGPLKP